MTPQRLSTTSVLLAILLPSPALATFYLAGQPVRFEKDATPRFTTRQVKGSSKAARLGLAKWAATAQGRRLIERFDTKEFEITVTEDDRERGFGRAPQPSFAVILAASNPKVKKAYELLLNPRFDVPEKFRILPGEPSTPDEMMAAAWAAEMLHIYFYSIGVSLPHHARADFRRQWAAVAAELGWPTMRHGEEGGER